jgi:hypothetical protein
MSRINKNLGHGSQGDKPGMTVLAKASSNLTNQPNSAYDACVEAGPNTSIIAMRAVGGDEKGIQCLGI